MFPKRNLAFRPKSRTSIAVEDGAHIAALHLNELMGKTSFCHNVHENACLAINNRLQTQTKVPNEKLCVYTKGIFDESLLYNYSPAERKLTHHCLVKMLIIRGEKLAAKDVDGSSDPYVIVLIGTTQHHKLLRHNKHKNEFSTSIKEATLNPVWNEKFEVSVDRDVVQTGYLHIQVWDSDDDTKLTSAKKVRGVAGLGR